jgi:uncharacterized membrane protein
VSDYIYKRYLLILSVAGTLFSGYLSATKFFTKNCALSEPCPYFFGFPACYFGFGLFFIIFTYSLLSFCKTSNLKIISKKISIFSFLGILFALNFTLKEIPALFTGQTKYSLGLPTCAYGLFFFAIIFVISFRFWRKP